MDVTHSEAVKCAIQLQLKRKTMGKLISLELAFYGVKKQQEGTIRDHPESFGEDYEQLHLVTTVINV